MSQKWTPQETAALRWAVAEVRSDHGLRPHDRLTQALWERSAEKLNEHHGNSRSPQSCRKQWYKAASMPEGVQQEMFGAEQPFSMVVEQMAVKGDVAVIEINLWRKVVAKLRQLEQIERAIMAAGETLESANVD